MFYELARLAIGNLGRARARLVMTSGGVLVGTTAVILLVAFTIGLQQAAEAGIGSNAALTEIQVFPNYAPPQPGATTPKEIPKLDVNAVRKLWRIPGVAAVVPVVTFQSEVQVNDYLGYFQIIGVDPALLPFTGLGVEKGQFTLGAGEMLIGAHAGDYFYNPKVKEGNNQVAVDLLETPPRMRVYQYTGQTQNLRKVDVKISGKLRGGTNYDYMVMMPIKEVLALREWSTNQKVDPKTFVYDQIMVRASSRETTTQVIKTIRDLGFGAGGIGDFINQLNEFFGTMRLMLGGVGGVALLVAAFGVANTMTMAILERTKEIGLMKAIGASDRDVLTVFLIEAGLVGLAGGTAGVGLAFFLQRLINQALVNAPQAAQPGGGGISFLPFDPSRIGSNLVVIPPELAVFAMALATAVGLGAGLYPALRAARLPPVIALKQE